EVNLITVVVRRVVAGSDDNAGVGLHIADSKGKLRSRARAIKDNGVTSVSRCGFGCKPGKFLREMPSIMCDDNFRPASDGLFATPFLDVANQSARGARDIEIVHRVGANTRKFRVTECVWRPTLCFGHNLSDGATAQASRSKGECFVEAIVQFLPFICVDQFTKNAADEFTLSTSQGHVDVCSSIGAQFSIGERTINLFGQSGHCVRYHFDAEWLCKRASQDLGCPLARGNVVRTLASAQLLRNQLMQRPLQHRPKKKQDRKDDEEGFHKWILHFFDPRN